MPTTVLPHANGQSYGGLPDPMVQNYLRQLAQNAITLRGDYAQKLLDPRRDVEQSCGHPRTHEAINPEVYQFLYDREPIAARVVRLLPSECWKNQPTVYEAEDVDTITPFEQGWDGLGRQLRGDQSWHQQEAGSVVWEYLRRADELSGVGHYGVILLGLDDGEDFSRPVATITEQGSIPSGMGAGEGAAPAVGLTTSSYTPYRLTTNQEVAQKGSIKLRYVRCFPESLADVTQFESNPHSPRFGQPTQYLITLNDPNDVRHGGIGLPRATIQVHWTRVIHLADVSHQANSSEVFAVPRLRPVLDPILDIRKVRLGSAEMYWKGAFPGVVVYTHPQLGGDVEINAASLRSSITAYQNDLQRYLALTGMAAQSLSPQVVDPGGQIRAQLEAISIELGVPLRILMGSERGELASSQDALTWDGRLQERRNTYLTPRVICPFIDRMILLGILPAPGPSPTGGAGGYVVEWPDPFATDDATIAKVAESKTRALVQYVTGGVESVIPPLDYLTRILDFTEEEARSILDAAEAAMESDIDTGGSRLLGFVGGIQGMTELFQKHKDGVISETTLKEIIKLFYKVGEERAVEIIADGLPTPMLGEGGDGTPGAGGEPGGGKRTGRSNFSELPSYKTPSPYGKQA